MILKKITGDITDPGNKRDIVIAMNTEFGELTALGSRFLGQLPSQIARLGSVLTFQFDNERMLHMAVCHNLCDNGWRTAPAFLRYCLDTLWAMGSEREYSIVQVGHGEVGRRYGADVDSLKQAMEDSFLPVTLFIKPDEALVPTRDARPLTFIEAHCPLPVVAV